MNLDKDDERIQTATMYLADTIALWSRMCYADIVKGFNSIETWNAFKMELKKYFYSENVEFVAYKELRRLKHDGSLSM